MIHCTDLCLCLGVGVGGGECSNTILSAISSWAAFILEI